MGWLMLTIEDIHFRHAATNEIVIAGISFKAQKAKITTILGPNGSGKTSLLKCIAGIWTSQKGEVYFEGKNINHLTLSERAKIFSLVTQGQDPTFDYLVFDMVLMGRACYISMFSSPSTEDHKVAQKALQIVGIEHLKSKHYSKISQGERQLTLIARALAQQTPVILLDEPTSHLDLKNQINILKTIKKIAIEKQLVVILTLHDINLAGLFSDKLLVIKKGKKIADGSPQDVLVEETIKSVYDVQVKKVNINNKVLVYPVLKDSDLCPFSTTI